MGEAFSVKPEHVAGYGKLVYTTGMDHLTKISAFGRDNARSDGGFTGLMDLIRDPVDTYAAGRTASRRWVRCRSSASGSSSG